MSYSNPLKRDKNRLLKRAVKQGFAVMITIGLFGLTVAFAQIELVDRIIAVVNNDIILLSDLNQAFQPFREKLKEQGYSEHEQDSILDDKRSTILEQLINEKLTDQQVERHRIQVSDSELDEAILRIKEINQISDIDLQRMLQVQGITLKTYRKDLRNQLLRRKLVNREVNSKIVITEADVQAYYDANANQYSGAVKYHLRHILKKVPEFANEDERLKVRRQIEEVYKRLQAGEDFAELATAYSESASAAKGGDLGLFEAKLLAVQIRKALSGLTANQFTPVIDTQQGFQIFYIEKVERTGARTLEEVKPEIEEKLYAEALDQRFQIWFADLRKRSHIHIMD